MLVDYCQKHTSGTDFRLTVLMEFQNADIENIFMRQILNFYVMRGIAEMWL